MINITRTNLYKGKAATGWVEGYLAKDSNERCYIIRKFENVLNKSDQQIEVFEVIPNTVSQYTEEKDINKIKIYENDIVKTKYGNGIVVYSDGAFYIKTYDDVLHSFCVDDITVIGTDYDNHDLIGGTI